MAWKEAYQVIRAIIIPPEIGQREGVPIESFYWDDRIFELQF
jgi:hypothetical protein